MKKNLGKRLAYRACSTAALTAFLAGGAINPLRAATFTLPDPSGEFMETWTIEWGDENEESLIADEREWESVSYGDIVLNRDLEEEGITWLYSGFLDGLLGSIYLDGIEADGVEGRAIKGNVVIQDMFGVNVRERAQYTWDPDDYSGREFVGPGGAGPTTVPEPSAAIALSILGLGAVASRLRRRSKK